MGGTFANPRLTSSRRPVSAPAKSRIRPLRLWARLRTPTRVCRATDTLRLCSVDSARGQSTRLSRGESHVRAFASKQRRSPRSTKGPRDDGDVGEGLARGHVTRDAPQERARRSPRVVPPYRRARARGHVTRDAPQERARRSPRVVPPYRRARSSRQLRGPHQGRHGGHPRRGTRRGCPLRRRAHPGRGNEPRRAVRRARDRRRWSARHARRHRSTHPHGAPVHGHHGVRGLLHRDVSRGGGGHHVHHRLCHPRAATEPTGGVPHLARVGGEERVRLLLPRRRHVVGRERVRGHGHANEGARRELI